MFTTETNEYVEETRHDLIKGGRETRRLPFVTCRREKHFERH